MKQELGPLPPSIRHYRVDIHFWGALHKHPFPSLANLFQIYMILVPLPHKDKRRINFNTYWSAPCSARLLFVGINNSELIENVRLHSNSDCLQKCDTDNRFTCPNDILISDEYLLQSKYLDDFLDGTNILV